MKKTDKPKPKFIFLIWMELPENFSVYAIPYSLTSKQDRNMLRMCHGKYVNTVIEGDDKFAVEDIERSLTILSDRLVDPSADWITDKYIKEQAENAGIEVDVYRNIVGSWRGHKLDMSTPKTLPRSKVFVSGFVM